MRHHHPHHPTPVHRQTDRQTPPHHDHHSISNVDHRMSHPVEANQQLKTWIALSAHTRTMATTTTRRRQFQNGIYRIWKADRQTNVLCLPKFKKARSLSGSWLFVCVDWAFLNCYTPFHWRMVCLSVCVCVRAPATLSWTEIDCQGHCKVER